MTHDQVNRWQTTCDHSGCTSFVVTTGRHVYPPDWQKFGKWFFCPKHYWPDCERCGKPMRPDGMPKQEAEFTVLYGNHRLLCRSCQTAQYAPASKPAQPPPLPDETVEQARAYLLKHAGSDLLEVLGL